MERRFLLWAIAALLALNLVVGAKVFPQLAGRDEDDFLHKEIFNRAMTVIKRNYVESVSTKELVRGALKGMLSNLDPHSAFLDEESFEEMEIEATGRFGGLGIEITKREGFVTIISPIYGTPAYRAGLLGGDKIVKIEGEILRDPDLNDVVKKLRGEPGTKVTVSVIRGHQALEFTLTREIIKVPSIVEPHLIDDTIGYVRIAQFQERTAHDLDEALTELEAQGMESLILDVRANPGGLLKSAVNVADLFLRGGQTIVSTKGRVPFQNSTYKSTDKLRHPRYPMIVLVNSESASSSEIVGGALKDLGRALLLGERTFGKGSVQTILPLRGTTAIRLTTARYFTPSGASIHEEGVEPDIEEVMSLEEKIRWVRQRLEPRPPRDEGESDSSAGKLPENGRPLDLSEQDEMREMIEEADGREAREEEEPFVDRQLELAVKLLKAGLIRPAEPVAPVATAEVEASG